MARALIIFILMVVILAGIPSSAAAFRLVPCGTSEDKGTDREICNFGHLVGALMRLINYLISVAAIVAMYNVLSRGWDLMTAFGNPEKIKRAKEGISNALVGFAMIILAFIFINLVVNLIFGNPTSNQQRPWWDPKCIYDITNPPADCKISGDLFAPRIVLAAEDKAEDKTVDLTNPLDFGDIKFSEPGQIVKKTVQGFAGIIGLVAIAFTIFNGFKLVIAGSFAPGKDQKRNEAKEGLLWSVGGFIVALLAFTLVSSTANFLGFEPSRVPTGDHNDTLVNPIPSPENGGAAGAGFLDVLGRLMTNFLGLLGFATTLVIIYYGYRYLTAAGNEEAITQAKDGLKWAIIGLAVTLLAFTIITAIRQYLVF